MSYVISKLDDIWIFVILNFPVVLVGIRCDFYTSIIQVQTHRKQGNKEKFCLIKFVRIIREQ